MNSDLIFSLDVDIGNRRQQELVFRNMNTEALREYFGKVL